MARQRSNTVQPKPARRLVHKASASTSGDAQLANFPLALSATVSIQTIQTRSSGSAGQRESLQSIKPTERYYTPDEMAPYIYISRDTVEAVMSELQPTSISLDAFHHVNIVWDELVLQLITHAQSINPTHIRTTGINGVFRAEKNESTGTRALAREAMSDAETEYRMFVSEAFGRESSKAFNGGQGNGMVDDRDMEVRKALNMLRHKMAGSLTCNAEEEDPQQEEADTKAFHKAGGTTAQIDVAMASVFLASLSEQVMMPIIKRTGEVVGRDLGSTTATVTDLYTALSEHEPTWGFFKRFQCRYALEDAIKPKNKRSIPPRLSGESKTSGRLSALAHPNASDGSGISLVDAQMNGSPKKRLHIDKGISSHETPAQQIRKSPSMSSTKAKDLPDRASSALSMHTRGLIGAWDQAMDADRHTLASSGSIRSKKEHLDEFDALMKSGETMKVSLTPNRLKTFDANGRSKKIARGIETAVAAETSASPSTAKKLQARDPRVKREIDEEDTGKPFTNLVKRKETWMDLVTEQKEEVLEEGAKEKERLVPPIVLGTAPPRFSPQTPRRGEAMKNTPGMPRFELPEGVEVEKRGASPGPGSAFATLPRSAQPTVHVRDMAEISTGVTGRSVNRDPVVLGPVTQGTLQARRASGTPLSSPKKKTPAQEMADFFNSPPPPGFGESKVAEVEPPLSASTVRSAPEKEKRKGLRGFMSRIGGKKGTNEEPPSAYSQGISSSDVFPPGTKRLSGGGIGSKGGRYGSRSGSTNTAMSDAESQFNAQFMDSNGRFSAKEYAMAMEAKKKQSLASLSSFAPTTHSVPASQGQPTRIPSPTKLSQTTRLSTPNLRQLQIQQQPLPQPPSAMPAMVNRTPSASSTPAGTPVRRNSTISRKPVPPVDPSQARSQNATPTLSESTYESPDPAGASRTASSSVDSHTQPQATVPMKGLGILGAAFEPVNAAAASQARRKSLPLNSSTTTSTTEINVIPEVEDEKADSASSTGTAPSSTRSKAAQDTEQQLMAARSALAKAKAKARRLSSNGGDEQDDIDIETNENERVPAPSPGLLTAEPSPASSQAPMPLRTRREVSPTSLRPRTADGAKVVPIKDKDGEGKKTRPKSLQQAAILTSISADGSFVTAYDEPLGTGDSVGGQTSQEGQERSTADIDSVPEAPKHVSVPATATNQTPTCAEASGTAVPSIPISQLAPLHDLLRHATSAAECRMLITAFLLQMGIQPLQADDKIDPEQKVMAWLLSGGDGPVGVPADMTSRAFGSIEGGEAKDGAAQVEEQEGGGEWEGKQDKAESISDETERTVQTAETSLTEDAAEPVTPVTEERSSQDRAVVV